MAAAAQAQLGVEGAALFRQGVGGMKGAAAMNADFGRHLVVADFNGDHRQDVAVSVIGMEILGVENAGAVHVIYGGTLGLDPSGVSGLDDRILALGYQGAPGEGYPGEQFASGGLTTGDFDGDGYDDLAVASTFDVVDGKGGVGSVLIVHGGPTGLDPADALYIPGNGFPVPANVEPYRFGHSLIAGDFDGDGYDDLAVGHRAAVDGIAAAGVVNVFYGSPASLAVAGAQTLHQGLGGIPGVPEDFDLFGSALASGDFDGDGHDDLAIGTIADEEDAPGAISSGSVTVVAGSDTGLDPARSLIWIRQLIGEQTSFPQFGHALASGDFDADGFDDLVATSEFEDVDGIAAVGAVWLRHGGASGFGPEQRLAPGHEPVPIEPTPSRRFGEAFAVADFDGNGRDDLAISSITQGPGAGELQPGLVSVLYSDEHGFDAARSQAFSPATEGMPGDEAEQFGFGDGLAAGDLDGDGDTDLAVGVPFQEVDGLRRVGALVVLPGFDPSACQVSSTTHCLQGRRFRVEVTFQAPGEAPAQAHAVPAVADDSGLFWFFEADNWEIQVKVLNGCAINSRFWVYAAATTDVAYTLTVTDTESGEVRDYASPAGAAQALADTDAFATCPAPGAEPPPVVELPPGPNADACPAKPGTLCLHGGRFQVSVAWTAPGGAVQGNGTVVPFGTTDSGLFWFFEEDNWELLVKVLDACALNGRFWVFSAATTDVEYRLQVHDRQTNSDRFYDNPAGVLAEAVTDTDAFGGCP